MDWAPPREIRIKGKNEGGSYRVDEDPEFEVELEDAGISGLALSTTETLRACLKDSSGNPTEIQPEINRVEDKYQIKIPRKRSIQPGLYKLVVEYESHEEEIWFTWGLVSVNTRKSMYHPDEAAEILMVVLDKDGYLVSEADVSLTVTSPCGDTSSYSTLNGTVEEIEKGIYKAEHSSTWEEGNYSLSVTATSTDVTSHIESYFSVRRYYEFDILRETPLTIDPQKGAFESSIHVLSHINVSSFSLREYLPLGFEVVDGGGASVTTKEDAKILTWNVSNNSTVSYRAQAPLIWPYLYQLGPAVINYAENAFKEARPWFLAVDPTTGGNTSGGLRPQNITCYGEGSTTTCDGSYPSDCPGTGGTDYLSCNDGNQEAHTTKKGAFAGVEGTYYSSTTTNCAEITKVEVCYEWSSSSNNPDSCEISIDNDGDGTWTAISTSCPGSAGASGCSDVTNQEGGWTCPNFFGASGTRAALRSRQSSSA
ncbi:MAG: hypothetical protein KAU03_06020, partial [Candidatus Altiarchaeales archaeon]|nr:hypothetical protein [Candidatus Altiarchaeales archaeon]